MYITTLALIDTRFLINEKKIMPYNIAMASDFFYPQPEGVESH